MTIGLYFLNVGQGACTAILDTVQEAGRNVRQACLVDVGADGRKLAQWLSAIRVERIPLVAITHNDRDHIVGLEELVHGFARKVGTVLFVPDRPEKAIPFWVDAQAWVDRGLVGEVDQLKTAKTSRPGMGRVLLEPPRATYRLHCVYPTMFDTAAAVRGTKRTGGRLDHGPNATSAVMRLASLAKPDETVVLLGGDLNFPGWQALHTSGHRLEAEVFVVPHHGAPRYPRKGFAHTELARAVHPRFAVFSVGTRQKHVRRGREKTARHPHPQMVRELGNAGAKVLCTQITGRCLKRPEPYPGASVLPADVSAPSLDLSISGTACAGSIVIVISDNGEPTVLRLDDHQTAVDGLAAAREHPLCRP